MGDHGADFRSAQRRAKNQDAVAASLLGADCGGAMRAADLRWQCIVQRLKADFIARRTKAGFNPSQPRVPAENPDGGQWTAEQPFSVTPNGSSTSDDDDLGENVLLAQYNGPILDVDGYPYYKPGGHHEMPHGIYSKWDLSPETRKIFDQSTTGKVPEILLRSTPDGAPIGHAWNEPHRIYNEAVKELSENYLQRNNLTPKQMTPVHAQDLLKEIRESPDPRIRDFNSAMRLMRRLFRLRPGRGRE